MFFPFFVLSLQSQMSIWFSTQTNCISNAPLPHAASSYLAGQHRS